MILAKQLIETGQNDCVLAVGFEKMERGSLGAKVMNTILIDYDTYELYFLIFSSVYRPYVTNG